LYKLPHGVNEGGRETEGYSLQQSPTGEVVVVTTIVETIIVATIFVTTNNFALRGRFQTIIDRGGRPQGVWAGLRCGGEGALPPDVEPYSRKFTKNRIGFLSYDCF